MLTPTFWSRYESREWSIYNTVTAAVKTVQYSTTYKVTQFTTDDNMIIIITALASMS